MEVDARRPKRPKRRGPKRPCEAKEVQEGRLKEAQRGPVSWTAGAGSQLQGEPATAASCRSTGGWIKIYSEVQMTR